MLNYSTQETKLTHKGGFNFCSTFSVCECNIYGGQNCVSCGDVCKRGYNGPKCEFCHSGYYPSEDYSNPDEGLIAVKCKGNMIFRGN